MTWQPIATAPRDGTRVLLGPAFPGPPIDEAVVVGYWDRDEAHEGGQCWRDVEVSERLEPTHWMPLPDPPVSTNANGGRVDGD